MPYGLAIGSFTAFGIITFVFGIANFEALKQGKLSVVEVVLEVELPVAIVLGLVLLQEKISLLQLGLMGVIFVGVALVAMRSYPPHLTGRFEKGVALALVTAVGLGVIDYLTAHASRSFSPLLAIWVPWTIFTLLCFFVIARREGLDRFVQQGRRFPKLIIATGLIDMFAWVFYAFALHGKELAVTTAITESYPAIALLLGVWINREWVRKHQYVGVGLALTASVILAFVN